MFNYAGTTDVVVDVAGYYTDGFHPVAPARIVDTRSGACGVRLGPGETRQVAVAGAAGVPAGTAGAVALNVTVVNPTASTYLTVWPSGQPQPGSSNVNAIVGTVPNMVTVGLGADGRVSVYNYAGSTDVLIDVAGWFDGAGGVAAASGCVASGPAAPALTADLALPPKWALTAIDKNTPHEVVSALQERLDMLGFWLPDYDGVFGSVTSQAVLAFQKYVGLPATGVVDDYTALLLNMQGLRAAGQSTSGDRMEVDLTKQLLYVIRGGQDGVDGEHLDGQRQLLRRAQPERRRADLRARPSRRSARSACTGSSPTAGSPVSSATCTARSTSPAASPSTGHRASRTCPRRTAACGSRPRSWTTSGTPT